MRYLVDENLSPRLADHLRAHGYIASHVGEVGLQGAPDERIAVWAARGRWTVVTQDADFFGILGAQGSRRPSVIRIAQRGPDGLLGAARQAERLTRLLPRLQAPLARGAAVTIHADTHRVVRLPFVHERGLGLARR